MKQRLILAVLLAIAALALTVRLLKTETGYRLVVNFLAAPDALSVIPGDISKMNNPLLVDVRTEEEFAVSHIRGAGWVALENLSPDFFSSLPKEKPLVFYCTIGARSKTATETFRKAGFRNTFSLYGGIILWKMHGFELEDHTGRVTTGIHPYQRFWNFWAR